MNLCLQMFLVSKIFRVVFRIRIYFYADLDPGSYFSPVGSGSGVGGNKNEN